MQLATLLLQVLVIRSVFLRQNQRLLELLVQFRYDHLVLLVHQAVLSAPSHYPASQSRIQKLAGLLLHLHLLELSVLLLLQLLNSTLLHLQGSIHSVQNLILICFLAGLRKCSLSLILLDPLNDRRCRYSSTILALPRHSSVRIVLK